MLNTTQVTEILSSKGIELTAEEVAALARNGAFPRAVKDNTGRWQIPPEDVEAFAFRQSGRKRLFRWITFGSIATFVTILTFISVAKDSLDLFYNYIFQDTETPTSTSLSRADKLYYVFMVDASSRMSTTFDGDKTKWDAAREAALGNLLYGLPAKANYGLIVLGGATGQDVASCDAVTMSAPLAPDSRETVGNIIKAQQASGVAPVAKAFDLARDQLLGLPDDQTATNFELFVFLGGGDTCLDNDLQPLLFFLQNSAKYLTNTHVDIFLLSNENIEQQILMEIEKSNKEIDNVEVKITTSIVDLEEAANQSLLDAQERARRVEATTIASQTTNFIQNITATGGILTLIPSETPTPSPIPSTSTSVEPTSIVIEATNFMQNITATGGILTLPPSETATPSPIPNTSSQGAEVVEGKIP